MMRDDIIQANTLRVVGNRVEVGVKMPWYRALPLSSVCELDLDVDGVKVEPSSIRWGINGHDYSADELPPLFDEWWFVTDVAKLSGEVSAEDAARLGASGEHEVHAVIGIYIPYIDAGAGILKVVEADRKTLQLEMSAA